MKQGSATCLPSDFPRYPGAAYAGFTFDLNGAYPGNTCHTVFESDDDVATVTAFYQGKLNTGASSSPRCSELSALALSIYRSLRRGRRDPRGTRAPMH